MARYAEKTPVEVPDTILEIHQIVRKYGGAQFIQMQGEDRVIIGFTKDARQIKFQVTLAPKDGQLSKSLMRSLLLVIKANLEAVASGVQTTEDAFMANIVLPDGKLVSQHVRARLAEAYDGREMQPLLPDYSGDQP